MVQQIPNNDQPIRAAQSFRETRFAHTIRTYSVKQVMFILFACDESGEHEETLRELTCFMEYVLIVSQSRFSRQLYATPKVWYLFWNVCAMIFNVRFCVAELHTFVEHRKDHRFYNEEPSKHAGFQVAVRSPARRHIEATIHNIMYYFGFSALQLPWLQSALWPRRSPSLSTEDLSNNQFIKTPG